MLLMDTEQAKKTIVEAKVRMPMMAKLKDNKHVDLYLLYFNDEKYIIAEIDWDNNNQPKYYMVDEAEIGNTILPDEEWKQVLEKGIEEFRTVVDLLKRVKDMK